MPLKNFCAGTKTKYAEWKSSFGVAQNVWDWHKMYINFWSGPKKFELAQNTFGPVEGRGMRQEKQDTMPLLKLLVSTCLIMSEHRCPRTLFRI